MTPSKPLASASYSSSGVMASPTTIKHQPGAAATERMASVGALIVVTTAALRQRRGASGSGRAAVAVAGAWYVRLSGRQS